MFSHKIHLVVVVWSVEHSSLSIHLVMRIVHTSLWLTFLIKFLCNHIKWMISYTSYTQVSAHTLVDILSTAQQHQQQQEQRQKQHSFNIRHRFSTFLYSWCVFRCVEFYRSDTQHCGANISVASNLLVYRMSYIQRDCVALMKRRKLVIK